MSTLQQIMDRVRSQTDLDDEDLPDEVLIPFVEEAFERTFAYEQRWPFLETSWDLTQNIGEDSIAVPDDFGWPQRLLDSSGYVLRQYNHSILEETFEGTVLSSSPQFFSIWGDRIYLWPAPDTSTETVTCTLRGYRRPQWSADPALELDGDSRLHPSLFHYAVALAYAQQEDPDMEGVYMSRWAAGLDTFRRNLMKPRHDEPLILNSGRPLMRGGRWEWGSL